MIHVRIPAPLGGAAFAALCALATGCASSSSPQSVADAMTRAIYADDLDKIDAYFDDDTKKTVDRAGLGEISDRMHELGDYRSISQRDADPDKGRYEYDATFSRGQLLVQLRIDPSGKVGAYRIVPQAAPATAGSGTPQNS